MLDKYKKPFMIIYPVFLLFGFFFVKNTLNDDSINISEKVPTPKVEHVEEYDVSLSVPYLNKEYKTKLKNNDTVLDLLENLRRDDTNYFYYEKTLYTYGMELCCINDTTMEWKLLYNGEDITRNIDNIYLEDDGVYVLEPVLTRTSERR